MNNKAIVKAYIEEVLNKGNLSLVEQFIDPEYTEVYNNQRYQVGINGAKEHILGVRNNYPDIRLDITQQIEEGEWVATCYKMQGSHSGNWMGMQPTGKTLEVTGVNVDRVVNGKITEHGGAANMFEGLLAIGAIQIVSASGNEETNI